MLNQTTQQIAHIRKPTEFNGLHTYPPLESGNDTVAPIRNHNISIYGEVYSVPMGISRNSNQTTWLVSIGGRLFYFQDDRHNMDPRQSYAVAYDFFLDNVHKDPATIPARPRNEPRNKNIEFGITNISANWYLTDPTFAHQVGEFRFLLRLQVKVGYKKKQFSISLTKEEAKQIRIEAEVGKLVYMRHIHQVNKGMDRTSLAMIWSRVKEGKLSTPLPYPIPDATMGQINDNLAMRMNIVTGIGHIQPHTNQYVR